MSEILNEDNKSRIRELEERIKMLEQENQLLKSKLSAFAQPTEPCENVESAINLSPLAEAPSSRHVQSLSTQGIERYSRQLLLSNGFGVTGQAQLAQSKVLIIGAGGIGSTVILYLAAFGVGTIGIMDFDHVETSNLHRQVIHKQRHVGMNKALSARLAVLDLNPTIQCNAITERLTHENAMQNVSKYDVVIDASDNPPTRYLINDACVLAGKPLVSGSAVEVEGQLTVYNHNDGPCYRCLYPNPAVSMNCGRSCSDAGVLGPVPGLVGILQAMEAVKILTQTGETMDRRMLHYNAMDTTFATFKKPPKRANCPVCGPEATISTIKDSLANLEQAQANGASCNSSAATLSVEHSISCSDYQQILDAKNSQQHVLLDVRVPQQYELCSLEGSINIPLAQLPNELDRIQQLSAGSKPVYCICRRGVASAEATKLLLDAAASGNYQGIHSVCNIAGGLQAWRNVVDSKFPNY
ncbi:hypothetical protein MPSEU_000193900 [Mayamaea pseudoterrestris]|nr:hypothetical protein MPSEU_000193900 [Mayamaea pseudoterrestris]